MKKFVDHVLNPQWFALCYLPFLAINMMQPINPMMFTRVLLALFAVWGVAVAAKCYFTSKQIWVKKYLPILLCFLAVCLATEVLNFQYGGVRVIGEWCFFAICILLLYTQNTSDMEGYSKLLKRVSAVLGFAISAMMLISLWMFVNMVSVQITARSGNVLTIGFTNNRLYGVYSSPNVGGLFATILIWCSIITLYLRKDKKKTYPIWVVIAAIQIFMAVGYISVALSYGTFLLGFAFVTVFLLLRPGFRFEEKLRVWQRYAVRIVSVVVALVLCAGVISFTNVTLVKMMQTQYQKNLQAWQEYMASAESTQWTGEETTDATVDENSEWANAQEAILENAKKGFDGRVEAQTENRDISNKRFDIWKNHLEIMRGKNVLTGVNDPLIYFQKNSAQGMEFTHQQLIYIEWAKGNMHNGFLQIFVNCGIVALALMLVYLLICFVKCLGMFTWGIKHNIQRDNLQYTLFALTAPMVVCILVDNLVETNFVLMGANFFQAIFWFAAGICVFCVTQKREEKE